MMEIENDVVLGALQAIVLQFGEEIKIIAVDIVHHLLSAFSTYINAAEDDDEAAFAATQCLDTVSTVIEMVKDDVSILQSMEQQLLPLIQR